MSKAEERAWEWALKNKLDPYSMGQAYGEGYHQAEKDIELTWKDIELIVNIDKDTDNEESIIGVRNNEEHYEKVLKRFKESKRE